MKNRTLKAIFLGLLSRRRAADKSAIDRAAAGAPQTGAAAQSRIEPASSDQKAPSAGAEAAQMSPGPPAHWLAKHSSGPPSHWIEHVRNAAPELLRDREEPETGVKEAPLPPEQIQPKSFPRLRRPAPESPPPRLRRPAPEPPLRLQPQRPLLAPASTREPEQSSRGVDYESGTISRIIPRINNYIDDGASIRRIVPRIKNDTDESGAIGRIVPRIKNDTDESGAIGRIIPRINNHIDDDSRNVPQINAPRENVDRYPDVPRREVRRLPVSRERAPLNPRYRQVTKREEEVMMPIIAQVPRDRRVTSYDNSGEVPADRWPSLFEASPEDYFDEAQAVWRELSHKRRLAREQSGELWNE